MNDSYIHEHLRKVALRYSVRMKVAAHEEATATDTAHQAGQHSVKLYCQGVLDGIREAMVITADHHGLRLLQAERESA
jgi:hypothetical protein